MLEPKSVILERLKGMSKHWDRRNSQICFSMAIDMTKLSWTLKSKNELFMSEILETVFSNIDNVQNDHRLIVNKNIELNFIKKISSQLDTLIDNYEKDDFLACVETLKEIRYITTVYQLNLTYNVDNDEK